MSRTKRWKRTNDIRGHERNFTHICSSCGHDKFILRYSQLHPKRNRRMGLREPTNEIAFKCEQCSLVDRFVIHDTERYIKKILKLRNGVALYLPPREEWEAESKIIKQRLKDLGYI